VTTLDERAETIAARWRTMRGLLAVGGREPDPLGMTPGWAREASVESDRLVKAVGEVLHLHSEIETVERDPPQPEIGELVSVHALFAIAHLVLEDDPDGYASALHLLHWQGIDVSKRLANSWAFADAAATWEQVEALIADDGAPL
jgi:hypothetical protein